MGCKQSYMIGRNADAKSANVAASVGALTSIVGANPSRIGVAVAIDPSLLLTAGDGFGVGPRAGSALTPLVVLTREAPSAYLSVEQYGSLLLGPLYNYGYGADNSTMYVTDVFLTKKLEDF